ncbi:MAG: helix-turn-helix transcriptional regulator [Herpetosiphonaceae bacterium]|nr:helix-turn-helix transcriptional regulator [Herpetosiphonaceae bacterium]
MTTLPTIELLERTTGCCTPIPTPLSEVEADSISNDFQIFAHPVRVQILTALAASADSVCVCDLETAVAVKQPTVSYHLKLLRDAGLVSYERQGPWAYYTLNREAVTTRQARIRAYLEGWG